MKASTMFIERLAQELLERALGNKLYDLPRAYHSGGTWVADKLGAWRSFEDEYFDDLDEAQIFELVLAIARKVVDIDLAAGIFAEFDKKEFTEFYKWLCDPKLYAPLLRAVMDDDISRGLIEIGLDCAREAMETEAAEEGHL